jgi:O-methyltransferase involved in polyketide biosynthesis
MQQKLSIEELKSIPETLLYPLKSRYVETKKKNGVISDPLSVEILDALDYDHTRSNLYPISQIGACLRTVIFDEQVRRFLESFTDSVVVNIGCGLDTRFPRLDNGQVLWFDLDLPEAIELRRKFFKETERHRFIACSALDPAWAETVPKGRPTLFVIEGLSFYFTEHENQALLKIIQDKLPGSECLIEIMAAWYVNMMLKMATKKKYADALDNKAGALIKWGINSGMELEAWPGTIKFIEEFFVIRRKMSAFPWRFRLMFMLIPMLKKANKIVRIRVGCAYKISHPKSGE